MSFLLDIQKFTKNAEVNMTTVARKVCLDLSKGVIVKTPIDTGRAKGNWQAAIGEYPTQELNVEDKQGTQTINKATMQANKLQRGDTFYLVNNLPYIAPLEVGWSQQAPQGMVRLTLREYPQIVEREARSVNK